MDKLDWTVLVTNIIAWALATLKFYSPMVALIWSFFSIIIYLITITKEMRDLKNGR
jgi:hypothetical protein